MTAVIFGAGGQDGYYLSQLLQQQQYKIIPVGKAVNLLDTDITNYEQVHALIRSQQPDYIFHLAANSTTNHTALFENHATISTGTLNILEAVKTSSPQTKVFISGSGLQFKNQGNPIKETDEFEGRDAYSVSRIHSVYQARYYRGLGLNVYVGYFFNHDSPLRTERHVSKKIAEAARRIAGGSTEKLEIGDISVVKEWAFAGDIVKAVWTLVNQDKIAEAVLGTGQGYSIEAWLQECFSMVAKDWREHTILKKDFTPEYSTLIADPALINSLHWKPEVTFQQLAQLMMKS